MLRLHTLFLLIAVNFPLEGVAKHWIHVDSDTPKSEKTALLILNGFGGTRGGCKAQMAYWEDSGMDVYIADVLLRKSLAVSTKALADFVEEYDLAEYGEIKAICYIAGAYLLHTQVLTTPMPNLTAIVYDRSPTQERAPAAARDGPDANCCSRACPQDLPRHLRVEEEEVPEPDQVRRRNEGRQLPGVGRISGQGQARPQPGGGERTGGGEEVRYGASATPRGSAAPSPRSPSARSGAPPPPTPARSRHRRSCHRSSSSSSRCRRRRGPPSAAASASSR